jgi:hypothetical protein
MKISILGAGNVGGTLGRAWAEKGHDVPDPRDAKTQPPQGTLSERPETLQARWWLTAPTLSNRTSAGWLSVTPPRPRRKGPNGRREPRSSKPSIKPASTLWLTRSLTGNER